MKTIGDKKGLVAMLSWHGHFSGPFGFAKRLVAIILMAGGLWSAGELFYDEFIAEKRVPFTLLTNSVHLGDNYRAAIGGDVSKRPNPSNCYQEFPEEVHFICLDKDKGVLFNKAVPTPVLFHLEETALPDINSKNIAAWKHIVALNVASILPSERKRAVYFDGSPKIWRDNVDPSLTYYSRMAPFMISFQLSPFEAIVNSQFRLKEIENPKITFNVQGMTGGKRRDQDDRIYVFLNRELRRVVFPSRQTRKTRLISFDFDLNAKDLRDGKQLHFGIFVLPWQENGPVPPSDVVADQRGPAHFQDVDINTVEAILILG